MKEALKHEKEQKGCGECVGCLSKCPECGSADIDVQFSPIFEYDHSDSIRKTRRLSISCTESRIKMQCMSCSFDVNEEFDHEKNELFPLKDAILDLLGINNKYNWKINDDGKWEVSCYNYQDQMVAREENPDNSLRNYQE